MGAVLLMSRAEERSYDVNVASSLGIPRRMVRSYSLSVIDTPAVANSSFLQHRLAKKSLMSPPFAQHIFRNAW